MKIVITTPTGHIGSRVARLLVQAGVRPTLLVRDPGRLDPELRAASEVCVADQDDAAAIATATQGASALFWLNSADDAADPVAAYVAKGRVAAEAVRRNRIPRVVFLSSIGAELRRGAGVLDGLGQTEELLNATDASVVHLRPGFFFTNFLRQIEGLRQGVYAAPAPSGSRFPYVDPRDIGDVAAARLLDASWKGRHVQAVHGPEDLTFAESTAVLSAATGRKIAYVEVPDDAFHARLLAARRSQLAADAYVKMYAALRAGFTRENPRTFVTTTPTTLGAWAYTNLRPLLA
jgi:uncharacterized protein YbjT (DUF2867 family)